MTPDNFYLAPLQGYTKVWYRNAFHSALGGADKYFTPFFEEHRSGGFDPRLLPELDIELNSGMTLIPQVVANEPAFLIKAFEAIHAMGYNEVNLNMGCPFPMLVKRNKGGGLMNQPDMVRPMLDTFFEKYPNALLSVKMRSGLDDTQQGVDMVRLLNNYPLTEVIIHPRLVVQQYKGEPDWDAFDAMAQLCRHPLVANGDINKTIDFELLKNRFPQVQCWMMGRGWLGNPSLAMEIRDGILTEGERLINLMKLHKAFHQLIMSQKQMPWQLQNQLLMQFWYYPALQMENGKRWFRRLGKANKPETYHDYINEVMW